MADPIADASVEICDAETLKLASDTSSPVEEAISNNINQVASGTNVAAGAETTGASIDDISATDDNNAAAAVDATADAAVDDDEVKESTSTKDCLQVTSNGDPIMDEENSEIIKRKKLSLTLPLLNITDTAGAAHTSGDAASPNGTAALSASSSCKIKKIYESDDTFIQTIFSQTIKSTTVTPTDDDPSYAFEDFHGTRIRGSISSQQTKSDSLLTDDTPVEKLDMQLEGLSPSTIVKTSFFDKRLSETSEIILLDGNTSPPSDKPTETFAYFHQTIDEDEPPFNDVADVEIIVSGDDDNDNVAVAATTAAASEADKHSPTDACLDEFIDPPVDTQTNTEPLTNAIYGNTNTTNTITTRTASCTQDIAQITLSSSPEPSCVRCDDNGDCSNDNNNTNASNTEQGNDASEKIIAADAISSYDDDDDDDADEHTENNSLTSTNSSVHVSFHF